MKLSQFKNHLNQVAQIDFVQPNGIFVPKHFHITEAGMTTKHFIDCGGTVRTEKVASFQLWSSTDLEHRVTVQKLQKILHIAEPLWGSGDLDVEIEYQMDTISRWGIDFNGTYFVLTTKHTNCLAQDHCGMPKENIAFVQSKSSSTCVVPNTACCS